MDMCVCMQATKAKEAIMKEVNCSTAKVGIIYCINSIHSHWTIIYSLLFYFISIVQLIVLKLDLCGFDSVRKFVKVRILTYICVYLRMYTPSNERYCWEGISKPWTSIALPYQQCRNHEQ